VLSRDDEASEVDAAERELFGLGGPSVERVSFEIDSAYQGREGLEKVAASLGADEVWVTSDNPRDEDPQTIINAVLQGVSGEPKVEPDRARAIFEAIGNARCGDVVLIAGKGHEDYQEIAGERVAFSDVAVARKALEAWA